MRPAPSARRAPRATGSARGCGRTRELVPWVQNRQCAVQLSTIFPGRIANNKEI